MRHVCKPSLPPGTALLRPRANSFSLGRSDNAIRVRLSKDVAAPEAPSNALDQSDASPPFEVSSAAADIWEIPVTNFVAGAQIPGKDARYVKIQRRIEKPDALHLQTVKIYEN